MDAADSRFDYLSCADGSWSNKLHGVIDPEIKEESSLRNGRGFLFYPRVMFSTSMVSWRKIWACSLNFSGFSVVR